MTIKFRNLIITFILAIGFYSCLNYTQVTIIKKDKTGEMFIHWWIKWNSIEDTMAINKIHIFNSDTIQSRFNSKHTIINSTEVYTNFEDSTLHGKIKFDFSNFDSLITIPILANTELSILNGPEDTQIFSQYVQPLVSGYGLNIDEGKIRYIYYFPGKIIRHNAHSIYRNQLIWEFSTKSLGFGTEITATYRPFRLKETPKIIYYLVGIVLIVVIIFLFKKRK
jgi:hypothetical protein